MKRRAKAEATKVLPEYLIPFQAFVQAYCSVFATHISPLTPSDNNKAVLYFRPRGRKKSSFSVALLSMEKSTHFQQVMNVLGIKLHL